MACCTVGAGGEGQVRCQIDICTGNARVVVAARTISHNSRVIKCGSPVGGVVAILAGRG